MRKFIWGLIVIFFTSCVSNTQNKIITVDGEIDSSEMGITLEHEHVLVDFIGADSITPGRYDSEDAFQKILPYLMEVKAHGVKTLVECTPNYLGRDVKLLQKLSSESGINILTNTGFYGAQNNKFIPKHVLEMPAEDIAQFWIAEYEQGIEGTGIKPGFIKMAVDRKPLSEFHATLAKAAAIAHKATGLTIMSHTGPALGAFQQLEILKGEGVSPEAFIWTHASNEEDWSKLVEAAKMGCWVSLDKYGWSEEALKGETLAYLKEQGVLNKILISHDAGWVDPVKPDREYKGYTLIFEKLIPNLKSKGFTDGDIEMLLVSNPANAFTVKTRLLIN
ncbi:phosphotriesterase family protein [Sunxiuqinia sp. A32]|uniref:phosphotriesterase family protein n=1 Tax=Sunxiuqinia sp. A32 TaxID=3461496 RepID=UPI0040464F42